MTKCIGIRNAVRFLLRHHKFHKKRFNAYHSDFPEIADSLELLEMIVERIVRMYHRSIAASSNAQLLLKLFNSPGYHRELYLRFVCPAVILIGLPSFPHSCSNPCGKQQTDCDALSRSLADAALSSDHACNRPCIGDCDILEHLMSQNCETTDSRFLLLFNEAMYAAGNKRSCRLSPPPERKFNFGTRPVYVLIRSNACDDRSKTCTYSNVHVKWNMYRQPTGIFPSFLYLHA